MTEQQQAACAELARRIGWDFIQSPSEIAMPGIGEWYTPLGRNYGDEPPDYFTDAAASHELVAWLAKQERSIQREFVFSLREATDEVDLCYELRLLTAEPSVIARAACKVLGVEVEESVVDSERISKLEASTEPQRTVLLEGKWDTTE